MPNFFDAKKQFITDLIRILLLFVIVFVASCSRYNNNEVVFQDEINKDSARFINIIASFFRNDGLQISYPDYVLNIDEDSVMLKDFINPKGTLILVISKSSCFSCCLAQLELLAEAKKLYQSKSVVVLADFEPNRDLYIYWESNQIDFPLLYVNGNKLGIPYHSSAQPYYFTTNDTGIISLFFNPIVGFDQLTVDYFINAFNRIE